MDTHDDNREYLTKERFEKLEKKLVELKTKRRVEIAARLEYAKGLGDLSENAEYQEAKEEQMVNEGDVVKLEDMLARATLISGVSSGEVRVGSTIFVKKTGKDKEQFMIVGREEVNPLEGKISFESPLGKSFLGRKKNEKVKISTPRGEVEYHILEIA